MGNWLSSTTFNGLTDNRTFNNQNQITSNSTAAKPTYDADGNTITDDNGTQYLYDAWNRIIKTVAGSNTMYYTYDALGRRITIETNLNPVLDEYFSSNWLVVEEDQQGVVQNQYVWSSVHVLNRLKPIALCQAIYDGYTIAQAQAGGYKTETDCKKPRTKYLARSAEVVGHKQYISRGCDYVLPGSISLLFPVSGSSVEGDYLRFLAQRVPKDIGKLLDDDSQPELSLSESVSLADLHVHYQPLRSCQTSVGRWPGYLDTPSFLTPNPSKATRSGMIRTM